VGLVLSSSNAVWALPDEYRSTNTIHHGAAGRSTVLVLPVVGPSVAAAPNTGPAQGPAPIPAAKPHLPNTATGSPTQAPALALAACLSVAVACLRGVANRRTR
jgi:hypothetical protein